MTSPLLEVRELRKSYDEGRIEALARRGFSITSGEYLAITDPAAAEIDLLQLLGGSTRRPARVLFRGENLGSPLTSTLRSRNVGFIFQAFHLMPTLRVLENVQVPCWRQRQWIRPRPSAEARSRDGHGPPACGSFQRVVRGRNSAGGDCAGPGQCPGYLLADEPTGTWTASLGADHEISPVFRSSRA